MMVAASCMAYGCESLRILRWNREQWGQRDVPESVDVSDWLAERVDVKGLPEPQANETKKKAWAALVKKLPEWKPVA